MSKKNNKSAVQLMAEKFGKKLDNIIAENRNNCFVCGYKMATKDKCCGLCGTRKTGQILDDQETCKHSKVTPQAPHCTNCSKKL